MFTVVLWHLDMKPRRHIWSKLLKPDEKFKVGWSKMVQIIPDKTLGPVNLRTSAQSLGLLFYYSTMERLELTDSSPSQVLLD